MTKLKYHFTKITELSYQLGLNKLNLVIILGLYYGVTIICALLEATSMVVLVALFTGGLDVLLDTGLPTIIKNTIQELASLNQLSNLVFTLILLFFSSFVFRFGLLYSDGLMVALLRRKVQESVFKSHLCGDWAHMRNFSVGSAVGTNTQESVAATKYMLSGMQAIYFIVSATVLIVFASVINPNILIVQGMIALPLMLVIKKVFSIQSKLSAKSVELRNTFSSDITDRYNGLLQVNVDNNTDYHFEKGINVQGELTDLDRKIGICQAILGSFNIVLILTALIFLSIWLHFNQDLDLPELGMIATVGMLGLRVATQLNGMVAAVGTLSRLSGSVLPVLEAMLIPQVRQRELISESVVGIEVNAISFDYEAQPIFSDVSLSVKRKNPLLLSGRSGKGKTTLANLISGLYFPKSGEIHYIGESCKSYPSDNFAAKVGFVTQEIYLFNGTMRESLSAGRDCSDETIWRALEQVDGADFIRQLGGLDALGTEAGRSLSGGQRRRLGIARVLLSGADILIFDEVTAGLDETNKLAIMEVIERLNENHVVIVISHDRLTLAGQTVYVV